jgi:hypothetical protein
MSDDDDMRTYAMQSGYNKLLKGIGLLSIGVVAFGLAYVSDTSPKVSKAYLLYMIGGTVASTIGFMECRKGVRIIERL